MKMKIRSLVALLLGGLMPASMAQSPNILLIMADDLGWWDTRFQGNQDLETPHLDRLVREGMIFSDGYAASPVCTPTRASMLTGLSPARLGITNHAPGHPEGMVPSGRKYAGAKKLTYLPREAQTIAERLRDEKGYATGFVGKWHLSHQKGKEEDGRPFEIGLRPEYQGFDLNVGGYDRGGPPSYFAPFKIPTLKPKENDHYLPTRMADECIAFLRNHTERPFFLTLWNYSVHYPIEAPEDLIKKYESKKIENPAYAAMIEGMDRSIGRVLQELDELKLRDETLVIFTSDNGSLFSNGPLRANKGHLYEGGIRVPWVVRWPGKVKPGSRSEIPIISTDVFPTLLEVAELKPGAQIPQDGQSLVPILTGEGRLEREALYFHYPNYAFHQRNRLGAAIRKGDHKLIYFFEEDQIELFDLRNDLSETRDLSKTRAELAGQLKKELLHWLDQTGANRPYLPEVR